MTPTNGWQPPPDKLTLAATAVHLWRISLDRPDWASLSALLSADEQDRATRFHFERDRRRFIVARSQLRLLLGRYLATPPKSLQFAYSEYGKPSLPANDPANELQFNLSHAHELALYGFTLQRPLGVDIEQVRTDFDHEEIAVNFFSPQEINALKAVPPSQKAGAFFNGWTRKEAYIKAIGEGLSMPLHQFDVSLTPGEPAALLATRPDAAEATRWQLHALDVGAAYRAAVVVEASADDALDLRCWQL